MRSIKKLIIDASRLRSGGGIQHFIQILNSKKLSFFDEIIIFSHTKLENLLPNIPNKFQFKSNYLINFNTFTCLIWQFFFLKRELRNKNSVLLTLDSTTLYSDKKNIIINQDIIGFQKNSLTYFNGIDFVYNFFKYHVAKRAVKNSFAAIFTTNFAKSLFKRNVSREDIVIPHGVMSNIIPKKSYKSNNKCFDIIYVSPILPYKNHIYIIESLKGIAHELNLKVHFVGGGCKTLTNKLNKEISKYSLNDHFIFYPFLKHEEALKLMTNSDIALFTSSVECFGITLLEYMRAGMPIICSKTSSLPETLKDSGIYVDLNNTNDLKKAVELFYRDESLRKKFGRLAYENSLKYSWDRTTEKTVEFIIEKYEEANM